MRAHTIAHKRIPWGFEGIGELSVVPPTLLNFYDQFFLSVPRSLELLSREVEPHYYSTAWEFLALFPMEL